MNAVKYDASSGGTPSVPDLNTEQESPKFPHCRELKQLDIDFLISEKQPHQSNRNNKVTDISQPDSRRESILSENCGISVNKSITGMNETHKYINPFKLSGTPSRIGEDIRQSHSILISQQSVQEEQPSPVEKTSPELVQLQKILTFHDPSKN